MAKLGLLFIVIFCIIQFTFAARLRRDAVEEGIDSIKQKVTETFTKENVNAFLNKLGEFGNLLTTKASEIGESIHQKTSEALKN